MLSRSPWKPCMLTFLSINPDPRAHTAASESSKTAMEVEEEEAAEKGPRAPFGPRAPCSSPSPSSLSGAGKGHFPLCLELGIRRVCVYWCSTVCGTLIFLSVGTELFYSLTNAHYFLFFIFIFYPYGTELFYSLTNAHYFSSSGWSASITLRWMPATSVNICFADEDSSFPSL